MKISDIPAPLLSSLIISDLDREDKKTGVQEISLELNEEALQGKLLLVPVYQASAIPLHRARNLSKFALSPENLDLLQRYLDYVEDDRVFLALHHGYLPEQVSVLPSSITDTQEAFRNLDVLTRQALGYFSIPARSSASSRNRKLTGVT